MKTLRRKGFTPVGTIAVLEILAILAAIAIPTMFGFVGCMYPAVVEKRIDEPSRPMGF